MEKIGRNTPCHCGSGKKYKNCHQQLDKEQKSKNTNLLVGSMAALFVILMVIALYLNTQSASTGPPPGEAPAGKVWSSEHGHWHDIE